MAELEIKRTNFFDGQFLKQGEFQDLDAYHLHMRRRWVYVMFDKSGVIQANPADLTIAAENQKRIRVRAGMAIGKRDDLVEAKEIVLREDQIVDLNTQQPPLQAGDTAIVTVHYEEEGVRDPRSEGDVDGATRIREHARLTVHRNQLSGTHAANGEPFVRLGNVDFDTVVVISPPRDVAFLQTALLATAPTISVGPNQVTAGSPATLTVIASGGFNLSTLTAAQVVIAPSVGPVTVSNLTPTTATLSFGLAPTASPGSRTLTITINNVSAQTIFSVQGGLLLFSFAGVDEPSNDPLLKINGSGFVTPVTIQFAKSGGGLTPGVPLAITDLTTTQIRIPMNQIPADATSGFVQVQSGGQTVVSSFPVVPPAIITAISPSPISSQANLTITGRRFFPGTAVTLPGNAVRAPSSPAAFPAGAFGESLSDNQIVVRVTSAANSTAARVRVTTAGGIVQSTEILAVN